jgi:hypothetical protein
MSLVASIGMGVARAEGQTQRAPAAGAASVDPAITDVATGGSWGQHGHYRIVVVRSGSEHIVYSVFAQWVDFDPTRGGRVVASRRIAELSDDIAESPANPRFVFPSKPSEGVFELDLFARDSGAVDATVRVVLRKPEEVEVHRLPGAGDGSEQSSDGTSPPASR